MSNSPLKPSSHFLYVKEVPSWNEEYKDTSQARSMPSVAAVSTVTVGLLTVIPFIALMIWIAQRQKEGTEVVSMFDTFAGEIIGGHLTQGQAKAIDVITGAVLAPLLVAGFNFVFFNNARVSTVNENQNKVVPLRALVAASSTNSGSYNITSEFSFPCTMLSLFLTSVRTSTNRNFRDLIQARTWRLVLFALLTLLSAVARTTLTNIIGYEAYQAEDARGMTTIRLQNDFNLDAAFRNSVQGIEQADLSNTLNNLTEIQQAHIVQQLYTLLIRLPSADMTSELTDGAYIAPNVTKSTLDRLPQSTVQLQNLPAYRLSLDCQTDIPDAVSLYDLGTGAQIDFHYPGQKLTGYYSANQVRARDGEPISLMAFDQNMTSMYLGFLGKAELARSQEEPPVTSYGAVRYLVVNRTALYGNSSVPYWEPTSRETMSLSGLRCSMSREDGWLHYNRRAKTDFSERDWVVSDMDMFEDRKTSGIPIVISTKDAFMETGARIWLIPDTARAFLPMGSMPLTNGALYDEFARRVLYGSGEMLRILYDVAASNTSMEKNPPEYFTDVSSVGTQEHYRITFVPSLLLAGLISLIGAGAITLGMAAWVWRSHSMRTFRQVDMIRLVVDSVAGLRQDGVAMAQLARRRNGELYDWAAGYKVKYEKREDDGTTIVLEGDVK